MKMRIITAVAAVLLTVGCAKKVAVHPGAISNLDSYAYDVLLTEQDVLNQAKADVGTGTLNAKTEVNAAILQYNTTLALWNTYHANGSNADALTQSVSALVTLLGQIQKIRGKTVNSSGLTWPVQIQPVFGGAN